MTALPSQTILRTIFVHPRLAGAGDRGRPLPTHRLLQDLGHEVMSTDSLEEAVSRMSSEPTDLLILESPEGDSAGFEKQAMQAIQSLPADQQPDNVALIVNDSSSFARSRLSNPRVHTLLKPLHVHGLLHVLRRLELQ